MNNSRTNSTTTLSAGIAGTASPARPIKFSLLFFSSNEAEFSEEKYQLLFEAVDFADRQGFHAVWVPERHFNAVGGLFPNPSVIAAALAVKTKTIRIRAGSLVAPLHHAVRIAEEWSVVDNLSSGRVDLAFARGWNPNDFVLSPQSFSRDNNLLFSQLETVRKLWRGETVEFPNAHGKMTPVRIYPLPKQAELQTWLSCFGNLERFREAASAGANILTMIFNQTLQDMGAKIDVYRQLRREHDNSTPGIVSLMLHTMVHRDMDFVKAKVREPFLDYIKTAVNLHQQGIPDQPKTDEEKRQIAEYAYERYFRTAALFGTPESCLKMVDSAIGAGIDEIACQIDFGVDRPSVIAGLQYLAELKEHCDQPLRFSHSSTVGAEVEAPLIKNTVVGKVKEFEKQNPFDARDLLKSIAVLDRLGRGWLVQAFQGMGIFLGANERWEQSQVLEKLGIAPAHEKLFTRLLQLLARHGLLEVDGNVIRTTNSLAASDFCAAQRQLAALKNRFLQTVPQALPQVSLLEQCINQYPGFLQGRLNPMDVIFPGGSMELVEKVYTGNKVSDHFNSMLAETLAAAVSDRLANQPNDKINILEIGAGTGASSAALLARLGPYAGSISFFYTDIGPAFVNRGRSRFETEFPFTTFKCLDIDRNPETQGFFPGSMDFVLTTNVVHATRSIIKTLRNVKSLLKPGGLFFLNESTQAADFLMLIFGLTPGWWLFEDSKLRIEDSPLLSCSQWREALRRTGFKTLAISGTNRESEAASYQSLILSESGEIPDVLKTNANAPTVITECVDRTVHQDLAVIGMSGRCASADTLQEFWNGLLAGRDLTSDVSPNRWVGKPFYSADIRTPNTTCSKRGGFLNGIEFFDPLFFGISPKEALSMDPQQRIFLQEAWNAFEDSGYSMSALAGRKIGVFLGAGSSDYLDLLESGPGLTDGFLLTGNTSSTYSGRVAHFFDLKGPCLTIDTACSSSLVAVHLACTSIWNGESEMALAGGVSILTTPKAAVVTSKTGLMSQSGVLRPFDDQADGYVIGEAVNALVLKPLDAAMRDGDPIHAIIKGSGINHGGKKNGMLAPSPLGQTALQIDVFKRSGIDPESISYVEAHATGTRLGDAMEVNALTASFRAFTEKKGFCGVGSLKGNVGHSGQPSGITEVIKVILALRNEKIPPTIHFAAPNKAVNWVESPFYVNSEIRSWPIEIGRPRRAVVNSIGHSGTNAFVVLQEAPSRAVPTVGLQPLSLITLSARTSTALSQRAADLARWIELNPDESISSVAYTLNARRSHFAFRIAILAANLQELSEKLLKFTSETVIEFDLKTAPGQRKDNAPPGPDLVRELEGAFALLGRTNPSRTQSEAILVKLARAWLAGCEIDWLKISPKAATLSLPTYPFAKERYWVGKPAEARVDRIETPLLTPSWRTQELSNEMVEVVEPLLLFGRDPGLAQHWKNAGKPVFVVTHGSTFEFSGGNFKIRPNELADYIRLFEILDTESEYPSQIIHSWCYDETSPADAEKRNGRLPCINDPFTLGLESLFLLTKALAGLKKRIRINLLHLYSTDDLSSSPEFACVSGFLRSVQHENALFRAKTIQVVRPFPVETLLADWIVSEFAASGNSEIRYSKGMRQVRGVEIISPDKLANIKPSAVSLRKGGTYLITGGMGGVALLFAEHLVTEYEANLILIGRSELSAEKTHRLQRLGPRVRYYAVDIVDGPALSTILQKVKSEVGAIHGILHCAGVIEDGLLGTKTLESFRKVMGPKVAGTVNLHSLTVTEPLDFFALFSSLVSLTGNLGQGDYAAANRYLDGFSELREAWRASGLCNGRTVSINWPYWQEGGMRFPEETARLMEILFGLKPMQTSQGIAIFHATLASPYTQLAVPGADPERIRQLIEGDPAKRENVMYTQSKLIGDLATFVEMDLLRSVAALLEIDSSRLDVATNFSEFGMDSRIFTELAFKLNEKYGLRLAPAVLFGHSSLEELARFLIAEHPLEIAAAYQASPAPMASHESSGRVEVADGKNTEPVAIIGLAGIYPKAADIRQFWKILTEGTAAIGEIPKSRWDWKEYHGDPSEGEDVSLSHSGGFIDEVDKFDSLFFNISPREAALMDPRQRLFLQTVWSVLEDSGTTLKDLWNTRTGLFVGAQGNDYAEILQGSNAAEMAAGLSPAMLANRVSHFFNWHGPSEVIDTGCSSAAMAIHRAVQAIRAGECEQAVAGGVNLILSPRPHLLLSQLGLLSAEEQSKIYDKNGSGYLRGEGIGAVLLKPLSRALADRDPVYATVLATAQVHNGRTASTGLPNPLAQAEALLRTWQAAGIDPATISYLEAQGTGTAYGDQAELVAFKTAFEKWNALREYRSARHNFCGIGSIKPSIGHLETASAIAAFTKVALALKHKYIPPTLNLPKQFTELDLEKSPFHLQSEASFWESTPQTSPHRAGVHSFGFGGTIVHILLEEAPPDPEANVDPDIEQLFVLSAKTETQLHIYANSVADWLDETPSPSLRNLVYTFQVGREHMEFRLAAVVRTTDELKKQLREFSNGGKDARLFSGKARKGDFIKPEGSLSDIAAAWVGGNSIDWNCRGEGLARKISAPTYPFARVSHWVHPAPVSGTGDTAKVINGHNNGSSSRIHRNGNSADGIRELHQLIADLLQLDPVNVPVDEPLLKFGADSIFLMQLMRKLRKRFGLQLKVAELVECQTIRGIARLMHERQPGPSRPVPEANSENEVTAAEAGQLLESLDELTDDEVSLLLNRLEPETVTVGRLDL
ncbi:MAG: polyketide synthase [Verrucomicrobiales bacterium]|nr:polyketide synthase [Verrucomicrobiales bacterium]